MICDWIIENIELWKLWKLVFYVRCLKTRTAIPLRVHVKHRLIVAPTRNRGSMPSNQSSWFDTVTTCSQKTKNDYVLVVLTTAKSYESFIKCIQTFIIDSHYLICAINEILVKINEKFVNLIAFFKDRQAF